MTIGSRVLQIGGGRHTVAGWLNGDIIAGDVYVNATKRLQFPDGAFDFVFTEHFIEHLAWEDGLAFHRETLRVLRPGGVLRHSTPSLEKILAVYDDSNPHVDQESCLRRHSRYHRRHEEVTPSRFVNDLFRLWGHRYLYDRPSLEASLVRAGFGRVEWVAFGDSRYPQIAGRERHAEVDWMKDGLVMICEATKELPDDR